MLNTFLNSSAVQSFSQWLDEHALNVVVVIALGWFMYYFVEIFMKQLVRRMVRHTRFNKLTDADVTKRQNTLGAMLTTIARAVIFISATLIVFKEFFPHISLTPLFASAGIIGVAIGFGAQSLIKDFLTGLFIITENQYRVGDVVEIDGAGGTVEHVSIRSTVIRDIDGNVHYLPNGTISHVINKTMGFSKVNFTLSVTPDTDVDKLAAIINDTGAKLAAEEKWQSKMLDAPHFVTISSFSQLGMDVTIQGKTQPSEQWSVTGEMRRRLLVAFRKNKIALATPMSVYNFSKKTK